MDKSKTQTKTCALYLRISRQSEVSTSIERQDKDCTAYAERNGWTVVDRFVDEDVSAYKEVKRPNRDRLLGRLGEFDFVVVWKLDRLARSVLDASQIFELCEENDMALVTVQDPIDTSTQWGKAWAQMGAIFAELESAGIAALVESARSHLDQSPRSAEPYDSTGHRVHLQV